MSARNRGQITVRPAAYARQLLRLGWALLWLMAAAYIAFVPRRSLPGGEMPAWKQIAWVIIFAIGVCFAMTLIKTE